MAYHLHTTFGFAGWKERITMSEQRSACWPTEISKLAACLGKEQFANSASAKKTIKRIEKRKRNHNYRGEHRQKVEAYKCEHCHHWHIGRRSGDAKRRT